MMSDLSKCVDISVIISTYNRCHILPDAIRSALHQDSGGISYEVLVVDNNSTDDTRHVIESLINENHAELRYIFADKQGVSNARNAGISEARGSILAFMDDDVVAAPNWLAEIKRALDEHPEVDFVGGKVLPVWPIPPPDWLTYDHWSPLALMDYGDSEIPLVSENSKGLISANLAIRSAVFQHVGMFSTEVQLVRDGIGALEDHELLVRIWRAGGKGIYLPNAVVSTRVPLERMKKRYHRRWHTGHGRFYAIMNDPQFERSKLHLLGVPLHQYRQTISDICGWFKNKVQGKSGQAFINEGQLRFFAGYFLQRQRGRLKG